MRGAALHKIYCGGSGARTNNKKSNNIHKSAKKMRKRETRKHVNTQTSKRAAADFKQKQNKNKIKLERKIKKKAKKGNPKWRTNEQSLWEQQLTTVNNNNKNKSALPCDSGKRQRRLLAQLA